MRTRRKYPTVPQTLTNPKACRPASRRVARLTEIVIGTTAALKIARVKVAHRIATNPVALASHKYPNAEPRDRNATIWLLAPVRSAICPHRGCATMLTSGTTAKIHPNSVPDNPAFSLRYRL